MLGTSLGPYRIDAELGSGGMGTVYAATAEEAVYGFEAGVRVALKVIHPHLMRSAGAYERFLREAHIGQLVEHPNVVRCYGCESARRGDVEHHFLVMEYVEGQTLQALQDELGVVPEELCRHVGREGAKGLAAIHDAGALHRDVKPENVLITPQHVVKIMDLGVARLKEEVIRLSHTGQFLGTVLYAPPEAWLEGSGELDARADLYSLGATLYKLATGLRPHERDDWRAEVHKVMTEDPPRAGELNPQLSPFFEGVVHTLLAKDREDRFSGAMRTHEILQEGESGSWWQARVQERHRERRPMLRRMRVPRETALYARDEDLQGLRRALRSVQTGEGRVVLLEGEAGIGKTRLVDEFITRLQQEGEEVEVLAGSYPPGGAATAADAFQGAFCDLLGTHDLETTLTEYLEGMPLLIPAFARFLRREPATTEETLGAEALHAAFVRLAQALAKRKPTVIVIDDLHMAPPEGLALFAALAYGIRSAAVLLIGSARHGLPVAWRADLLGLEHAEARELGRLGPQAVADLVGDALGRSDAAARLTSRILASSDGNPYFILEMLRELRDVKRLVRSPAGVWVLRGRVTEIRVPTRVEDLILARLETLARTDRELLDAAAVYGFEFDPVIVAAALEQPGLAVLKSLGRLEQKHRLVRSRGRMFTFDHHQVQEMLYDRLPPPLREVYHATIGGALAARVTAPSADAVAACRHLLRSDRRDAALPIVDHAIEHLEQSHLVDAAIALLDEVLASEALLDDRRRVELLLKKCLFLDTAGRREEEGEALEMAAHLVQDVPDEALKLRIEGTYARHLPLAGKPEQALEFARRAVDRSDRVGDPVLQGEAWGAYGSALFRLARFAEARDAFERQLTLARSVDDVHTEAKARTNLAQPLLYLGAVERAVEESRIAVDLLARLGRLREEAVAASNLGLILDSAGSHDEAAQYLERSLDLAERAGFRRGEANARGNLGVVRLGQGRLAEALDHLEPCVELMELIQNVPGRRGVLTTLASLYHDLGWFDRCRDVLVGLLEGMGTEAPAHERAAILGRLGDVAREQGRLDEARELLDSALELFGHEGETRLRVWVLIGRARLAEMQSEPEEAQRLYREARTVAERHGDGAAAVVARAELARFGDEDAGAVERSLEELGHRVRVAQRIEVHHALHEATGGARHAEQAYRLLRELVAAAPEDARTGLVERRQLYRDIERDRVP